MKHRFLGIAVCAALLGAMTGCGGGSDSSSANQTGYESEQMKFTYFGYEKGNGPARNEMSGVTSTEVNTIYEDYIGFKMGIENKTNVKIYVECDQMVINDS